MRLAYQIATNEIIPAAGVTAYQANLEQSFAKVKEVGYDGVELMVCNPKHVNAHQIRNLSEQYELPVAMVCSGEVFGQDGLSFTLLDKDKREEAIERVKDAVDLAVTVGAPYVNIGRVRGGFSLNGDHEQERIWSVEGIKSVARYAKPRGIVIALEPVNSIAATFINSTQDGLAILKEIDEPNLKLMLDSNHMFLDDLDPLKSIQEAKGQFVYVHLADSNRLYPGNCKFDFKSFIDVLKAVGYDDWISIEVFQRPNQDQAIELSYAHIRPFLS